MHLVEFEPKIPVFDRLKIFYALDRTTTVAIITGYYLQLPTSIGKCNNIFDVFFEHFVSCMNDAFKRFNKAGIE
jgi:hypothetical protein